MTALFAIVLAVVGVASAAYGFAFVFSETKNRFFYFWFVLAAALIAPAVLMAVGAWNDIPLALRCAVGLVLLLFIVYEVVVCGAQGSNEELPEAHAGLVGSGTKTIGHRVKWNHGIRP